MASVDPRGERRDLPLRRDAISGLRCAKLLPQPMSRLPEPARRQWRRGVAAELRVPVGPGARVDDPRRCVVEGLAKFGIGYIPQDRAHLFMSGACHWLLSRRAIYMPATSAARSTSVSAKAPIPGCESPASRSFLTSSARRSTIRPPSHAHGRGIPIKRMSAATCAIGGSKTGNGGRAAGPTATALPSDAGTASQSCKMRQTNSWGLGCVSGHRHQ